LLEYSKNIPKHIQINVILCSMCVDYVWIETPYKHVNNVYNIIV
jgi:hypothetical protein